MRSCVLVVIVFSMATLLGRDLSAQEIDWGDDPFAGNPSSSTSGNVAVQKKDWGAELECGYQANSQRPLSAFLDAWHADSQPVAVDVMKKKLRFEQHVYDIYDAFFRPGKTQYLIIQDEITVRFVNSTLRREFLAESRDRHLDRVDNLTVTSTVVVKEFRPCLNAGLLDRKVLYLQRKYLACLVGFVTQNNRPFKLLRGNQYQWEENSSKERQRRLQYLNGTLNIVCGHWNTGWVFETEPTVSYIYLSSNMKRAIVRYRQHFEFGEALLERVGEHTWELLSTKTYAIE